MELCKEEKLLIVKNSDDHLEIRNYRKTSDKNESVPVCKLTDFFSNNIDFELSKISILQLENCDLNEIPSNIQELNLKQLILARNKLKEVPSCLYSSLSALELLDLSHNFIQSFDIEPACSCTIVTLKLNNNKMRNLPHWILNLRCPQLSEVTYSNNNVVDLKLYHRLNIKKLEMCNCHLMDVDFPFFKSLKLLEYLDISNDDKSATGTENRFRYIDHLFLKTQWKWLKVLNLSSLTVSILPQGIFWIKSLTELYLRNCDLSWIPSDIQYLVNLKILDVSNNSICSLPEDLTRLKNLEIIKAPFNSISLVANFTHHIQILDLYSNYLEAYPACASNIKFVDLEQNCFETENYDDYEQKRNQLRQMFSYNRSDGPRELPEEEPISETNGTEKTFHSESDGSVDYQNYNFDEDSDNWDEEKPVIISQKNPEITTSDDEWDGKEDMRRRKRIITQSEFDIYEDWIFCDAEED